MLTLIARRLGSLVLTLAAVSALIFVIMDVLPGDPAAIMLGTSASPDTLAALRRELGLDQPLLVRYFLWLGGLLTGDLGTSYTYGVPVAGLIAERLAVTLPLAGMAIVISVAIAIPLGVASAAKRNSSFDYLAGVLSQLFIAVPGFWVALLLILVFSMSLGWMPAGGFPGWDAGLLAGLKALLLPAVALALPQAGVLTRVTRSSVLEVLHEDFVRTARAKGLPERRVILRHALKPALVPVISYLGPAFVTMLTGSVVVDMYFSTGGIGRSFVDSALNRDYAVMMGITILVGALTIFFNLVVDVLYAWIDPKIRY